jgi:hypothetical protein
MENSDIMARATDLAQRNPPDVSLAKLLVFFENIFFGVFKLAGWLIGRVWFHGSRTIYIVGLAFSDGYRQGAKVPPKKPAPAEPAIGPQRTPMPPLMNDGRTQDVYDTPFGMPYGPNVQAFSERA